MKLKIILAISIIINLLFSVLLLTYLLTPYLDGIAVHTSLPRMCAIEMEVRPDNPSHLCEGITSTDNSEEQIVQYHCENSGGTFTNNTCECPYEEDFDQTSESQYETDTGYCITTHGNPGGEVGEQIFETIGLKLELSTCEDELATYQSE